MSTREAVFAGRFYPDDRESCDRMITGFLSRVAISDGIAAIVPHAGWVYSGACAASGIAAIAGSLPETVVVFGAAHVLTRSDATLSPDTVWKTPIGEVAVDTELAQRLSAFRYVGVDATAHREEHSIEVELPFIQRLIPSAKLLPLIVRPGRAAEELGRQCAKDAVALGRRVAFVGSTDLTHYGPAYGFEPAGRGEDGIRWAKEVNDRRFVELIEGLRGGDLVSQAAMNRNACGPGAVAATVGAALQLGATRYEELQHTTSAESRLARESAPMNSVGYEAGVFRRV